MLYLVLSRYWYRTFIQTYSATSPFNPHWEMCKTFLLSYSSSQITYVEAEAVECSCFRFHRKRTASTASACSFRFRFHIPAWSYPWSPLTATRDDRIVIFYYPILSCFWKIISVSDPNLVLVEIILSVCENYPKVYYDAQQIFLCFVYFATSAEHDWLK